MATPVRTHNNKDQSLPVGGRLGLAPYRDRWRELFPDQSWILSVVQEGLRISFLSPPPLLPCPQWIKVPRDPQKAQALRAEVASLLEKQAIEKVVDVNTPGFYSHVFVVPKPGGRWRPIIDLSVLNKYIQAPKFRMETARAVKNSIKQNEFAVSLDLTDAYLHVPIHRATKKFLRFAIDNQVYAFKALPFGLNLSPWVFTRLMEAVVTSVRQATTSEISHYLDDLLQKNTRQDVLKEDLTFLMNRLKELGFIVNVTKSDLVPSQDFEHLGMHFKTPLNRVVLTEKRKTKLLLAVQNILVQNVSTPREIAAVIGQMSAAAELIPLGRLHLRPVQFAFKKMWTQIRQDWDKTVKISEEFHQALLIWTNVDWIMKGVPLVSTAPTITLMTDSSMTGYGGHLLEGTEMTSERKQIMGVWSQEDLTLHQHINELEMLAVHRSILAFADLLRNQAVLLMTDNTTVKGYLKNEGGTFSLTLCNMASQILQFCASIGMSLTIQYIPSRLNVLADGLSRQSLHEWKLKREIFLQVLQRYPTMEMDLFANRWNHQLPVFVSPFPDQLAKAVDGLSVNLTALDLYAFPPFPIIPKVIQRLELYRCKMTLIAPLRWNRSWITPLLRRCIEIPRRLPKLQDLIYQEPDVIHSDLEKLNLHVFRLYGGPLREEDSVIRQLKESSFLEGPLL